MEERELMGARLQNWMSKLCRSSNQPTFSYSLTLSGLVSITECCTMFGIPTKLWPVYLESGIGSKRQSDSVPTNSSFWFFHLHSCWALKAGQQQGRGPQKSITFQLFAHPCMKDAQFQVMGQALVAQFRRILGLHYQQEPCFPCFASRTHHIRSSTSVCLFFHSSVCLWATKTEHMFWVLSVVFTFCVL